MRLLSLEIGFYWRLWKHDRTPRAARWALAIAILYALSPIDIIPDWIPLAGLLDDAVIVPVLFWVALRLVPEPVIAECRRPAPAAGHERKRV